MSLFKFTLCCLAFFLSSVSLNQLTVLSQDEKKDAATADDVKASDVKEEKKGTDEKKTDEAEKTAEKEKEADQPKSFEELNAEWQKIDVQFQKLTSDFAAETDATKKKAVRAQYVALLEKATPAASALREAAIKEFEKAPNENEAVTKLLVGIIVDHIAFERRDQAIELGDKLISAGVDAKMLTAMRDSDRLSLDDLQVVDELVVRQKEAKTDDLPRVKLETSKGDVVLELFEDQAPGSVGNFVSLIEKGFYNGLSFHRVIDEFVAQGGDPDGDGTGGPGYTIKDEQEEPGARNHFRGSLSMAHSNRPGRTDTGGSQFFICFEEPSTRGLNGKHTVFGRVISGMENVDKLTRRNTANGEGEEITPDKIIKAEVVRKRDHEYAPVKSGEGE